MRGPINLAVALALSIVVVACIARCAPVAPAKTATDAGDGGWHTVVLPADWDAGNGSLR